MVFPFHGRVGIGLIVIFWPLNWLVPNWLTNSDSPFLISHFGWVGFFPLWLGYCLTVSALTCLRKGNSILTRNFFAYCLLFVISSPSWWLFELINWRTQNWFYEGRSSVTNFQYAIFASTSFSTVIPAVFGTAEWVSTFEWTQRPLKGIRFTIRPRNTILMFILGWSMLGLLIYRPRYFFPFVWMSVHFILDPINTWLGHDSLLSHTNRGDWRPVFSLAVGCLICGFFWEMWNFYSYPKWIYQVPFVGFLKIFEMPLLGYGGYIPFSFEIYAVYHLITGIFNMRSVTDPFKPVL